MHKKVHVCVIAVYYNELGLSISLIMILSREIGFLLPSKFSKFSHLAEICNDERTLYMYSERQTFQGISQASDERSHNERVVCIA